MKEAHGALRRGSYNPRPSMDRAALVTFLRGRARVGDGAMGAALYTGGVGVRRSFDDLNRSDPERVRGIHAAHVASGAEVVTTNTFGANRIKLARYGLASEAAAINAAGVRVAREAAGPKALVFGSMGPTGIEVRLSDERVREQVLAAFREQARALVEAGVDAVQIETFTGVGECRLAIEAVREVAPDIGLAALVTLTERGVTPLGVGAGAAARSLLEAGADAVGSNCGVGPDSSFTALKRMREAVDAPLIAQPNAGIPATVDGRFLYPSSPDYVAHYAKRYLRLGVSLIGGCCGTGPEHVAAIAGVVRAASAGGRVAAVAAPAAGQETGDAVRREAFPPAERSELAATLASGGFAVSVEMDPPRGGAAPRLRRGARRLADAGIRHVNVADGPRASARMSAIAFAALLQRDGAVETILHYQCRDRNLIGIQADLLGAHALGIRNVLAVTGDPPKLGDYPHATPVFDVDSVGLVRILEGLNQGADLAGNRLPARLPFFPGVGVNPAAVDLDAEVRKFHRKVEAGALYCLTQPVYEPGLLADFLDRISGLDVPVLVGVLPLVSARNAEFLHNEVPGMTVPAAVRGLLRAAPTRKKAREVGVSVAREMVQEAKAKAAGVYVMPPFQRMGLAIRCVQGVV